MNVSISRRTAIPKRVREAVIARDGMTCRICGEAVTDQPRQPHSLHLDHVVHWAAGGEHTVENLRVTCATCNLGRAKATTSVRSNCVEAEYRDGTYWWIGGFVPPKLLTSRRGWSVREAARNLDMTERRVISAAVAGHLAASASSPIRVEVPGFILDAEREIRATKAAETRAQNQARAPKKAAAPPADRVAYWAELIEQRRKGKR